MVLSKREIDSRLSALNLVVYTNNRQAIPCRFSISLHVPTIEKRLHILFGSRYLVTTLVPTQRFCARRVTHPIVSQSFQPSCFFAFFFLVCLSTPSLSDSALFRFFFAAGGI